MPKNTKEDNLISELGNWNVANDFVREKIMKPLIKIDLYEDLAEKGSESIAEDLYNWNSPPNDVVKIKGFKWMIAEMIKLILNAKFALKKSGTKQTILGYKEQLSQIQKLLPTLIKVKRNHIAGTQTVSIKNPELYRELLEVVKGIKSKINEPLNKNHLIFVDSDEFDPQAYKKQVMEMATTRG